MHIYLGTFLLALVMLALEITLARMLNIAMYYPLAFLAISTAMLGMTAAATTVFLNPRRFSAERLETNLGKACLQFALSVPITLMLLCLIPVPLIPSIMALFGVVCITVASTLPFYFAGIAITLVLTKCSLPVGFIYACDLIGAAMGCLLVLGGLEFLDTPSLILLCGAIGALAGIVYLWFTGPKALRTMNVAAAMLLAVMAIVNTQSTRLIRPLALRGRIQAATEFPIERWNSFSRVTVSVPLTATPLLWGHSPKAPNDPMNVRLLEIDSEAGTPLQQFSKLADIEPLRFDVTNVAHAIRPHGPACVIGVGGGRDVQSAILFGHSPIVGIDVNPIFISLLKNEFRDFAGIATRSEVTLVADEARSYLSRSKEKFSVLQMSLIDTWTATGAGAMTLSENGLYTVEGWKVFIDRLADDGLFTVSRWYDRNNLGETGRLVSLAVMTLLENGVTRPASHLALMTRGDVATLILSKQPMNQTDVDAIYAWCRGMEFNVVATPEQLPKHPLLRSLLSAKSPSELFQSRFDTPFRFDPTTDEDPHFFNILRLSDAVNLFAKGGLIQMLEAKETGVIKGNLIATTALIGLIVILTTMSVLVVVVPLAMRAISGDPVCLAGRVDWSAALYFSLIGAGFMLIEIAFLQRLSVFLGHPVYGLGIVLFAIILSSGVGSLLSERLPLTRSPWVYLYPVVLSVMIVVARFALAAMMTHLVAAPMSTKIACSVAAIFPVGILLGFCFPTGMRLVRRVDPAETPWYWALNGIFGVLASAVAVFISIFVGISANFYLAAGCYLLASFCIASVFRLGTLPAAPVERPAVATEKFSAAAVP